MSSVKIMLSYDYCHFEVTMGEESNFDQVNEMRKQANRLALEAIRQFKIMRKVMQYESTDFWFEQNQPYFDRIKAKPESEWSTWDKSFMQEWRDRNFWRSRKYKYDYEDDFGDEQAEDMFDDPAYDELFDEDISDEEFEGEPVKAGTPEDVGIPSMTDIDDAIRRF